ncbi:hypothetical protein [Acidipila sp. EB88]|uniref:hypothetical protein n=1 Tax=Acidipila sp. EB88 TaxID=2305226 RepID=UPI000F5F16EE|nr:hypothetical protein [Acidipila sp. EB88]
MSDADKVAIDAFKPYQSGNDLLWVLHRLDIEDKHRVVSIPMIAVGTIGMHLTNEFIERELKKTAPPSGWGSVEPQTFWFDIPCQPPTKVGDELVIVKWNCEGKEDIKIAFDIAISEPVTMKRWPLVQTLEQMSELVAGIVNSFEKT